MSESIPPSFGNPSPDGDVISTSLKRVAAKILIIEDAVKALYRDRTELEGKIEDAQKRILHILSRLPEQSDGRQLNLLGEVVSPPTPEDDNEPTTH